jgi:hypothetical protein
VLTLAERVEHLVEQSAGFGFARPNPAERI